MSEDTKKVIFQSPGGVELHFELAGLINRSVAFFVDTMILITAMIAGLIIIAVISTMTELAAWIWALYFLIAFVLRNFYFVLGEMHGRGQTWGKRLARIRVIDSSGAPLTGNAIFLRNVTRDMELFLPLIAIFAPEAIIQGAPWWGGFLSLFWLVAIALVPIFHPKNMRIGDMIAGTQVVVDPKVELLNDMTSVDYLAGAPKWTFTNEQLDMYGEYELKILEDVLRNSHTSDEAILQISAKIAAKIGLRHEAGSIEFLTTFYKALRTRREQRLLFGERQSHKRDGKLGDLPTQDNSP